VDPWHLVGSLAHDSFTGAEFRTQDGTWWRAARVARVLAGYPDDPRYLRAACASSIATPGRHRNPSFARPRSAGNPMSPLSDRPPRRFVSRHRHGAANRSFLKATVKATPMDAHGQGSTIQHVGLAPQIQNNAEWTPADVLSGYFHGLQNRWSASLAMSTGRPFPSHLRHSFDRSSVRRPVGPLDISAKGSLGLALLTGLRELYSSRRVRREP
jgi:hypothetical protein